MLTVYGLKTCDTCRKARKWLDAKGIAHEFRDVREDGLAKGDVARWVKAVGDETLINRRGTTWRGLSNAKRNDAVRGQAVQLMLDHPALIKRPVFELDGEVIVGFGAAEQKAVAKLAGA
jgi:Spx/MgsR family transcriptional regulator